MTEHEVELLSGAFRQRESPSDFTAQVTMSNVKLHIEGFDFGRVALDGVFCPVRFGFRFHVDFRFICLLFVCQPGFRRAGHYRFGSWNGIISPFPFDLWRA